MDALQDAFDVGFFRCRRLTDRLVIDRQVVDQIPVVGVRAIHPLQSIAHDVANFVAIGGIVADDGGVGGGEQRRLSIGVLQALTGQGGPTGGGANQEATGHLVRCGPNEVAGALKSEHRIEHVDRHQRHAMCGIGGTGSGESCDRTGLVNACVQDLALLRLLIGEDQFAVHRQVVLPLGVVDFRRRKERVHAEGTRLVRNNRHHALAEFLVPHQVLEQPDERHGCGCLLFARAAPSSLVGLLLWKMDLVGLVAAFGDEAAEFFAAFHQVLNLGRILAWVVVRG